MKKILPMFAIILASAPAGAVELRQYASLKITDIIGARADISDADNNAKIKESFGVKAAYGVKLADFRTELELSLYDKADFKSYDATVRHATLTANAFYEVKTNSPFSPYIGAGIGYSRISLDAPYATDDSTAALALKGIVGVNWQINPNISLVTEYSYTDFGNYNQDSVDASFTGHELSIGARYSF